MKVAYYYPPHTKKLCEAFCKYTDCEFLINTCDSSVDLIYSGTVSSLGSAIQAKKRFNKPLAVWCFDIPYNWREWSMSEEGIRANKHRDSGNSKSVSLLKKCDLVISASKWTQSVLNNEYGISSEQIYFYINTAEFDSIKQRNKENNILQISRFFYNKKFEHSIMASSNIDGYKLVLIGTGLESAYGRGLIKCADKYNKNVVFRNKIPRTDTISEIKKAKMLVSPSVFEGWGITPIEALYCKVPVLLSDLDVFKEVYGDSVLYHERNNVEDMEYKLKQLIEDKSLQKDIVEKGSTIISDFTPVKFANRWQKLVKEI